MNGRSLLLVFCLATAMPLASIRADDLRSVAMSGRELDPAGVAKLEATVAENPTDMTTRARLLGYYFSAKFASKEARAAGRKHILWIIKNQPGDNIAGTPYCSVDKFMDPEGHEQAATLWREQTKAHSTDPAVLGNAAKFFLLSDGAQAETLLKQAQELEPSDARWPSELGHLYSLMGGKENQAKSLVAYQQAQADDPSEMGRFYRLDDLTKAAIATEKFEDAARYANDLISQAAKHPKDWNYGNAIHCGYNALGLVALQTGDLKRADECLLEAGKTPGSPQLNSFGPNMTLALALIEKGQKDAVVSYFDLCQKFWRRGADRLNAWTAQVKAGRTPDFGGNLAY